MIPATKQQGIPRERAPGAFALHIPDDPREDLTRQEFAEEADVNYLLRTYGVDTPVNRVPQFGEVDWDLDLHSAHISMDRAQHAFFHLPLELRQKYKTTAAMLDAMNSGELATDLEKIRDQAKPEDGEGDAAPPSPIPAEQADS